MPNLPLIASPQGTLLEVLLSSSDISDITSIGSGQIITTAERNLVNSSLQPGNNISLLNNNVGYTTVEAAQDAIGNALTDTETVQFIYNDGADTISATATPIFGQGAEDFINTIPVSFTTNTLFEAYSFTTTPKNTGRYRVFLQLAYEPSSTSTDDVFELRINGTLIGTPYQNEGKDTGSDQRVKVDLLGYFDHTGPGTFDIELWARQTGGGITTIYNCLVEVWRVS